MTEFPICEVPEGPRRVESGAASSDFIGSDPKPKESVMDGRIEPSVADCGLSRPGDDGERFIADF